MKHYWKLLAAAAAALCICIAVLFACTDPRRPRDILMLNDLVQTVREHSQHPETLGECELQTALLVFSREGCLVYASADAPDSLCTLADAEQAGWLCLPVTDDSDFYGTAAIPDPAGTALERMRIRLLTGTAAFLFLLLLTAAVAGMWLHRRVITPFRRMRGFAENIAQGNLDDPLLTERNALFGPFAESIDIMREELRASRQREEALRQREREMTAALSHDIKTPVTGIKLLCELLCVRTDDPYLQGKIGSINAKAEQIDLLANDLLSTSLDTIGELHVRCQDEPSAVLTELLREHDPRSLVTAEPVPECLLLIDRSRLSQVIGNILSNSYKYADTPVSVCYAFSGSFLSMAIRDRGPGIPAEELELVTQKYYRGKNTDGKDGSGLGLYISRVLMEKMDGSLICSAGPEGGLTVTLMIPLS